MPLPNYKNSCNKKPCGSPHLQVGTGRALSTKPLNMGDLSHPTFGQGTPCPYIDILDTGTFPNSKTVSTKNKPDLNDVRPGIFF